MPPSKTSAPLPTPPGAHTDSDQVTVLKALYDGIVNGRVGTPQERLAALVQKAKSERFMARIKGMSAIELSQIYVAFIRGEDIEPLLPKKGP